VARWSVADGSTTIARSSWAPVADDPGPEVRGTWRARVNDCAEGDDEQPWARAFDASVMSVKTVDVRGMSGRSTMHVSNKAAADAATACSPSRAISRIKEMPAERMGRRPNI